ncbi:hypothetical protein WA556_001346 [Blastocystis sp. ATCC 50177/Nand II]
MDEKIKIRYNYLFEYNKGPKRVFFKKAIKRREMKLHARLSQSDTQEHGNQSKQRNQVLVNEATATIEECSREIQIINAEIERLKEKKSSLNDLLSYYDSCRE